MKQKIANTLICICLVVGMLSVNVFASSGSGRVTVPSNGGNVLAVKGATRTGNYPYVKVKADAVTPTGNYNNDWFTKCKTRLYKNDTTATAISNWYTLTEGHDYTKVQIYEGVQSLKKFNINFKGNNENYAAVVYYSYQGK